MQYNSYQLAEIIGVNVSTIKRWTEMGKLNCTKTVGGHRKFNLNDISNFLKIYKKNQSNLDLIKIVGKNNKLINSINSFDEIFLTNYCYKNLVKGKSDNFLALNNALILKNIPLQNIFDKILIPVLKKIGDNWKKGYLSISEEHIATEIIKKFLANLNFQNLSNNSKYNAFCFTLINDKHDISINMGEAVLNQNKKIKTFNLGPNLPVKDFIKLSKKVKIDIIFVSLIFIENKMIITREINLLLKEFLNVNTKIFLCGNKINKINIKNNNFTKIDSFESFSKVINKHFR